MSKKTTRKALLGSVLALVLCVAMLVGSTFAWFTDEVTTGANQIIAGNLDVDVTTADGTSIQDEETLFENVTLWEPGAVAYENLTVVNKGNLSLKYDLSVNFTNENTVTADDDKQYGLSTALQVGVVRGGIDSSLNRDQILTSVEEWTTLQDFVESGTLEKNAESDVYGFVIWWEPKPEDNNWNVNNGKKVSDYNETQNNTLHLDLGVKLFATQLAYEKDSFGNQYDANAPYPAALVATPDVVDVETLLFYDILNNKSDYSTVNLSLDTAYTFVSESAESAANNEYADWFVDFYVSLDAVPKEGLILSGQYDKFLPETWVAFYVPTDLNKDTFYPLLGAMCAGGTSNWTYEDICSGVSTFNCGALDTQGLNVGSTMTVQLRIINPDNTDETIVVKEIKYTFKSTDYKVFDAKTFNAALKDSANTIRLISDIKPENSIIIPADAATTIDLGGHTITAPAYTLGGDMCAIKNEGTLTIKGEGTVKGSYSALYSSGNLTVNGGTYTATNGFGLLVDNIYGTEPSVAEINGGTFTGVGVYNPTEVTINGGTFNVGRDPDGACENITLFVSPTFVGAPNTATVKLNGGTFNGDIYVYDDGLTETVFTNNGATITGSILDNG